MRLSIGYLFWMRNICIFVIFYARIVIIRLMISNENHEKYTTRYYFEMKNVVMKYKLRNCIGLIDKQL